VVDSHAISNPAISDVTRGKNGLKQRVKLRTELKIFKMLRIASLKSYFTGFKKNKNLLEKIGVTSTEISNQRLIDVTF